MAGVWFTSTILVCPPPSNARVLDDPDELVNPTRPEPDHAQGTSLNDLNHLDAFDVGLP